MKYLLLLLLVCSCAQLKEIEAPTPAASLSPVSLPTSSPINQEEPKQPWRWENPSPQGNPITAFWGNSSLLLGVGAKGALIRSTDQEHFSSIYLNTTRDLYSVSGNDKYQFIAGEDGLWRSSDLGLSWQKLQPQKTRSVFARSAGVVYALAEANQFMLSRDNGDSWRTTSITQDSNLNTLWASDDGLILASQPNNNIDKFVPNAIAYSSKKNLCQGWFIWRSSDFGETWSSVSFSSYKEHPTSFWRAPSGRILGVGANHANITSQQVCDSCIDIHERSYSLFRSDDAGVTWKRLSGDEYAGFGGSGLYWKPPVLMAGSASKARMLVQGQLRTSADEGETWNKIKSAAPSSSLLPYASAIWVGEDTTIVSAQKLLRHQNNAWTELNASPLGDISSIASVSLDDGSVITVGYGIAKRSPSGVWRAIIPDGSFASIAVHQKEIWVTGVNKQMLRSTDNGETFTEVPTSESGRLTSIDKELYIIGTRGIARYNDTSSSWITLHKPIDSDETTLRLLKLSDGSLLATGRTVDGRSWEPWLKISKDNGATWTFVKKTPTYFEPNSLIQQDGTLWLGGRDGVLYQCDTLGAEWREMTLSAHGNVERITKTQDGTIRVFVSRAFYWPFTAEQEDWDASWGYRAVLASSDQGRTWVPEELPIEPAFLQEIAGGILWFSTAQIIRQEK